MAWQQWRRFVIWEHLQHLLFGTKKDGVAIATSKSVVSKLEHRKSVVLATRRPQIYQSWPYNNNNSNTSNNGVASINYHASPIQSVPTLSDFSSFRRYVEEVANIVHHDLGEGQLETVYQRSLAHCLRRAGLQVHEEAKINIFYCNNWVGSRFCDLIVKLPYGERIAMELKTTSQLQNKDIQQISYYMAACRIKNGLVINFPKDQQHFPQLMTILDTRLKVGAISGINDNVASNGVLRSSSHESEQRPSRNGVEIVGVGYHALESAGAKTELLHLEQQQQQQQQQQAQTCFSPNTGAKACGAKLGRIYWQWFCSKTTEQIQTVQPTTALHSPSQCNLPLM